MKFLFLLCVLVSGTLEAATAHPPAKKHPIKPKTDRVTQWMQGMTTHEKVAQLVVVPFSGRPLNTRSKAYREFVKLVEHDQVGGLILVNVTQGKLVQKAEPLDVAAFLNKMQRLAKVPLLVSADLERGRFHATECNHGVSPRHGVCRGAGRSGG